MEHAEVMNETGEGDSSFVDLELCPKSCLWWQDSTTVVNQRSAGAERSVSEMLISEAVDEDCGSDVSANPHMQRGGEHSEMVPGGVAPFVERNAVASTSEWRWRVLHSQQATHWQATTSSYRQRQTAEERCGASFEIEIGRIRGIYVMPTFLLPD